MEKLQEMPDSELLANLRAAQRVETSALLDFLRYLAEIERRKLALELGHPSTWVFLTRALGYSERRARRRVVAARLLARFPAIASYLEDGRLDLTTVCELRDVLDEHNVTDVLERAAGLTEDEVRRLVVTLRPPAEVPPDIVPQPAPPEQLALAADSTDRRSATGVATSSFATRPISQDMDLLQIKVPRGVVEKLARASSLLSHKLAGAPKWQVLEEVLDLAISELEKRKLGVGRKSKRTKRRHDVPPAVAREVWQRDGGRCAYVAADGTRCGSAVRPEMQYMKPFARGGEPTAENVKVYCRAHNQLAAEKDFGAGFVAEKRAQARAGRDTVRRAREAPA